jgi:hypothetical protein
MVNTLPNKTLTNNWSKLVHNWSHPERDRAATPRVVSSISSILLIWRWEKKWGSYIRCEENFGNHGVAREREIFEHGHGTIFLRTNKELGTRGQMTYRSVSDRIQVDAVSPITTLSRRKSWATHGMLLVRVTTDNTVYSIVYIQAFHTCMKQFSLHHYVYRVRQQPTCWTKC